MARTRNQRKKASQSDSSPSSLLATYRPVLDRVLFVLAMLGILTTVHLWIQQGRGFDQGCWGFNPPSAEEAATFNCEAVVQSDAGKLFGISNVYWGMLFYLVVAILGYTVGKAEEERVGPLKRLRGALIAIGFVYSLYLVYYQFNSIGELCALCLTSAGIAASMFVALLIDVGTSKSVEPVVAPASNFRFYKAVASVVALLAVADLVYFNNLEPHEPIAAAAAPAAATTQPVQAAATAEEATQACVLDDVVSEVADYQSLLSTFDTTVGPEDSPVTVIEFFDPNCPSCQALHPVIKSILAKYGDRVRFHIIPYALRQSSVPQIEALLAAGEQGKFFEMLDAQMAMQETRGLPIDKVRELAGMIGMDVSLLNSRLRSGLYRNVVVEQRNTASEAGVNRVPTVIVNGKVLGNKSPECISQHIDEAL